MPKLTPNEIRARLLKNGDIQSREPMPIRVNVAANKQLSRLNAILSRRTTFKQQGA
jgi:hypothetical protein